MGTESPKGELFLVTTKTRFNDCLPQNGNMEWENERICFSNIFETYIHNTLKSFRTSSGYTLCREYICFSLSLQYVLTISSKKCGCSWTLKTCSRLSKERKTILLKLQIGTLSMVVVLITCHNIMGTQTRSIGFGDTLLMISAKAAEMRKKMWLKCVH